jgi:catechol-2,3-dioxygenase
MEVKLAVVSLWAEDIPGATQFYRDVIGLRLLFQHGGRPHFDMGGVYLVILKGCPQPPCNAIPERFPQITFQVKDLDTAIEHLGHHNIPIPWGVESDAGSRWIMVRDPANNIIELVQYHVT